MELLTYPDFFYHNAFLFSGIGSTLTADKYQASSSLTREFKAGGWCAKNKNELHWIQVDLGQILQLSKIGTHRLIGNEGYVQSFSLAYSNNGQSWETLKENANKKVLS